MTPLRTKSFTFTVLPAFAAFLILQACGGGGSATAQEASADPLEGVASPIATRGPGFGTWVHAGATCTVKVRFHTCGPVGTNSTCASDVSTRVS